MSSLVLKQVTHIDLTTGRNGGEAWILTLECGHVAVRSRRKVRYSDIVTTTAAKLLKRICAPERVRCIVCNPPEWLP